jgi:hypothetical protein
VSHLNGGGILLHHMHQGVVQGQGCDNNVNKQSGHLESTGIGAIACIHGTFMPDSVVDFQRGEA